MKRHAALLPLVLVAGFAIAIVEASQAPPNLSGTYRPAPGATTRPGEPWEITITQTADTVTIRQPGVTPETLSMKLDGTETRSGQASAAGAGAGPQVTSRAVWEGPKLVVTGTVTTGRGTTNIRQAYSLDVEKLTLETGATNPDGSAGPPRTATYVKTVIVPLPAPPARTVEAGYASLFNGKDLTGWKAGGPAESFRVENGAIIAQAVSGQPCNCAHLFYDGEVGNHAFRNFDLKLDVVARYRSNGGIYIMTEYQPQSFPAKGFEVQVNNSHTDRIRSGSLYHVVDVSHIPAKDDEWYPMEINVRGDTIAITLKGKEVLRWVQPPDWPGSYDFAERRIQPGTIGFQAHDPFSVTAYANIRIRLLSQ
jgi:hypothetical protein